MAILESAAMFIIPQPPPGPSFDEEQLAAASFLARYSRRTHGTSFSLAPANESSS